MHDDDQFNHLSTKQFKLIRTHLQSPPQAAHHQRREEGFPLVCAPQVLGLAHVHAHVPEHALCDVAPGGLQLALVLTLAQVDRAQRRCLDRRRNLEAQSDAWGS